MMTPNIEPFRIKTVEPIRLTTIEERTELLRRAHYNVTSLKSEDVLIDLLTDSGTTAMSTNQWAALQVGDESYVNSASYLKFQEVAKKYLPFRHIFPIHQGRVADRILASLLVNKGSIVPSNSHFDTTRGNIESLGGIAEDLAIDEGKEISAYYPFKGNIDIARLASLLETHQDQIPMVTLTITNNNIGGQPVSMSNIRHTAELCRKYNKPLFIDGCRFAENAFFIKQREAGYADVNIADIVNEMFSYADGMMMSAKKDAMVNIGGWLALNSNEWAAKVVDILLLTEGFITYGGLSGRDLNAMAIGLAEGIDENYLRARIAAVQHLGEALAKLGIPVVKPIGGHAVFIEIGSMLPHLAAQAHPAQTFLAALYRLGGIRACEISSIKLDSLAKENIAPKKTFVRLALPRRVYTQNHLQHVIKTIQLIHETKSDLRGLTMTKAPSALQNYAAEFKPIN